jgi:hypothetical protein
MIPGQKPIGVATQQIAEGRIGETAFGAGTRSRSLKLATVVFALLCIFAGAARGAGTVAGSPGRCIGISDHARHHPDRSRYGGTSMAMVIWILPSWRYSRAWAARLP